MKELQRLMKQKKEIEERIRMLKNSMTVYGCVKLDIYHYPTTRPDEWYIAVKVPGVCEGDQSRYRSIILGHSKEECIEKIPQVIKDLQGLYKQITEDIKDE